MLNRSYSFSRYQGGVSLVELMIGMVVGLIVLAGALTVFAKISFSGLENTRAIRLNQQMRETMDFIRRDIQRAGYTNTGAAVVTDVAALAAIGSFGMVTIGVTNLNTLSTYVGAVVSDDCILYSYDFDEDGIFADPGDNFSFRLNAGAVERGAGVGCGDDAAWQAVSDANVTITALTFELDATDSVIWVVEEGGAVEVGCGAGDTCFARRKINVVLEGELALDSSVKVSLRDEVKIKNDHYYSRP